jgi:hypothetical protein
MRTTIITSLFILFCLLASCQNNSTIKSEDNSFNAEICILINDLYLDSTLIEYKIDSLIEDSLLFKFPKVIPGTYRYNIASEYIKHFQCFDNNDKEISYKQIDDNTYLIPNSGDLNKINYYVFKGKSNDVYDALTRIVAVDSFCIINPVSFLGYFDDFRQVKHSLLIEKPNGFSTNFFNISEPEQNAIDRFEYESYDELVENPLLYCRLDTTRLINGDFNATITVYSDNKNITSSLISSWIRPISEVLNKYTSVVKSNNTPYRLMFIFSDEFELESALEQNLASVYCLRSNWDTAFLAKTIQHLVAHEYLHTITPLNFHSNIYNEQLFKTFNSKHLWFYEGVIEYLSLKANFESGQISIDRFMQYLAMMYSSLSSHTVVNEMSILELSQNILEQDDFNSFQKFYDKGALFAFFIDLSISIKNEGNENIVSALSTYRIKNGNIFDEESFIEEFLKSCNIMNINLDVSDHIFRKQLDSAFNSLGYTITESKIQWAESVYSQFFIKEYSKNEDEFYISFSENATLKNKRIKLLEIEKTKVSESLILQKLIYPANSRPIEIVYELDNKIITTVIKPITSVGYRTIMGIKQVDNSTLIMKHNLEYFIGNSN